MDLSNSLDNHQKTDSKTDVTPSLPLYMLTLNQQETSNVKDTKVATVLNVIRENLAGSDLLMCLFMAALNSYRVDRCLRPFPIAYISIGNKNVEKLRADSEVITSLHSILKGSHVCTREEMEILSWLYLQKDQPQLKVITLQNIEILSEVDQFLKPHFVFEVVYPQKAEEAWTKRRERKKTLLAYHGSQIDNFYSILKVGLQHNFSTAKELLYGKGIYLTTELSLSMTYAPFGHSWKHSILGNKHSIIAVCEVIDDIERVKRKDENFKSRAVNQGSISGKIPDKYLVVTDSQMLRLKYLLVYKEMTLPARTFWTYNNLALILTAAYVFSLFCIGFFQGPTGAKIWRRLTRIFSSQD